MINITIVIIKKKVEKKMSDSPKYVLKFIPTTRWRDILSMFLLLLFAAALVVIIVYPFVWGGSSTTVEFNSPFGDILSNFAKTITQQDIVGNIALFNPGATIAMSRLFTFLEPELTLAQWGEQLDVFFAEFISNHMTLTNPFNVTKHGVSVIGYHTFTLDLVGNTTNLPTTISSFVAHFTIINNLIHRVEVLPNATSTFVWYSSSGVESFSPSPPPSSKKRKRDIPDMQRWDILQDQINRLIARNQEKLALSICNTTQYLTLKSMFDPMGTNPAYPCNTNQQVTELTVPTVCSGDGSVDIGCLPTEYPFLEVGVLNVTNFTCPAGTMIDDDSCFPQRIATINTIPPFFPTDDFSLVGGPGIEVTGLTNGLLVRNLGVLGIVFLSDHPEFNATFINNVLFLRKNNQTANTFFAGPVSGSPIEPEFRTLVDEDITEVSAPKISGVLTVEQGGTGSGTSLLGERFMISFNNTIIEGPSIFGTNETGNLVEAGDGIVIDVINSTFIINASPRITSVDLSGPGDLFVTTSLPFTNGSALLTFDTIPQLENTFWAGPINGTSGFPVFREIDVADLPTNIPFANLIGILPIEKGGTNSGTSLLNDKWIVSQDGKLVEASLINGTGITVSISNGIITIDTNALLQLFLSVPTDILSVSGSPASGNSGSFAITKQNQNQKTFWAGPVSGVPAQPTFRAIEATDLPPIDLSGSGVVGVLPLENGGTGSNATLIGNRILVSNTAGNAIVETDELTDGEILIGNTGNAPVLGMITGNNGITVTVGPGTISLDALGTCSANNTFSQSCVDISGETCSTPISASCVPNSLSLTTLDVTGTTTLGTTTSCISALSSSCISISNEECPSGPIGSNCIPSTGIVLQDLFVYNLTAITSVQQNTFVGNASFIDTETLHVEDIQLTGMMTCVGSNSSFGMISPTCLDISNKTCPLGALDESCIPQDLVVSNLQSTGTVTLNNVMCTGGTFPSNCISIDGETCSTPVDGSCLPSRVATINSISPDGSLNFVIEAGTGISITPGGNKVVVANTGVTSVALSLPPSLFGVSGSPVTTTGTLTATLANQSPNTVWAGPTSGLPAVPTFRTLVTEDMPVVSEGQILIGNGAGMMVGNITSGNGISVTFDMMGNFVIKNIGVTSVGMTVPSNLLNVSPSTITSTGTFNVGLQSQLANTVFAAPDGMDGEPLFRNMTLNDLPRLLPGQLYIGCMGAVQAKYLTEGDGISIITGPGSIEIENNMTISMNVPSSIMSVSPPSITGSGGTFTASLITQTTKTFFAGPSTGSPAVPTFRTLIASDLPPLGNGQLYIGNAGTPIVSSLSAGSGITVTPGAGTLTVASTRVSSVALALPSSVFTVTGSPVTSSGTLTGTFKTQNANTVFAGPSSGGAAVPTFRTLTAADIPAPTSLNYIEVSTTSTFSNFNSGTFTVIPSMTTTPVAGTYQVSFSCSAQPSTSSGVYEYAIYNGATQIAHSRRSSTGSSGIQTYFSQAVVVANGINAITVQIRKNSGAGNIDVFERSMFLLRIA